MNKNYPQYVQKNRHLRQKSSSFAQIWQKSSCQRWIWIILSRLFKNSHIKRYLYIFQCIEPTSINESNQKHNLWKLFTQGGNEWQLRWACIAIKLTLPSNTSQSFFLIIWLFSEMCLNMRAMLNVIIWNTICYERERMIHVYGVYHNVEKLSVWWIYDTIMIYHRVNWNYTEP